MPRFFVDAVDGETAVIAGEDARHIIKSLRMQLGEQLTLCDGKGTDYHCVIDKMDDVVHLSVVKCEPCRSEPALKAVLYQALPKGDKMELIVQKAVELGVNRIVPVLTDRCISRPDGKSMAKKRERYQKIAQEAAKQCGRGVIPTVEGLLSFQEALQDAGQYERRLLFYEQGGEAVSALVTPDTREIAFFVGSEGGFTPEEAAAAQEKGITPATLGPRILRCETAPICALAIFMNITGDI